MKEIIRKEVLNSDLIAIADDRENRITYRELGEKAENLEKSLEERSLIFFLCDHQMETVELLYEILLLNRVPLLLQSDISLELLDNLIEIYQPQYIYCNKTNEIVGRYRSKIEWEEHVLLVMNNPQFAIHPDVAVLLSTSGTTGSPKLVKLSYNNLYKNAEFVCSELGIRSGQKGISPLEMNYVYGLNFCIWHWHCGATLLLTEEFVFSKKFENFYCKENANNFAGTPYIYQMLNKIQFWNPEKMEYLHCSMYGGAPLLEKDVISLTSMMKDKFWILYGQTESSGVVSGTNVCETSIKPGAIGKIFGNIRYTVDSTSKELILRSKDIVSMGYANNIEQLAEEDLNEGILHTGDLVYVDNSGCIYLKGRRTRYVKILDKRISLDEIEKYLGNKYSDIEFACVGINDSILIYHTARDRNFDREIPAMLDYNMKIPHKFVSYRYIEKIPRNNAGKTLYSELGRIEDEK